ncbi:MAG: UvrD-helicase domain-containing protein [Candidatus Symbiothrix sp.]|jgi:DNA helicase-2/ATP-dependent DNA helicase PcrA|nr:UvrD-helicase domain-containing protein [Candidatus Symbiothrix sp.]
MDEFLNELNENQRAAVLYNDGPSLVIAGAGSGKTRVITYKLLHLLKLGISPYHLLALTFTNKAAKEMKSRIGQIVGDDTARRIWMGTFHSVFSGILRRHAEAIGFQPDFTIYDSQDSQNLIKAIIKEKELDDKVYKASTVQSQISRAKNALITPEKYCRSGELIEHDNFVKRPYTCEIYQTYWNRCRTANAMDFDDLLLQTYTLFKQNPEILERYQNQFQFILVDEYQDTNPVQHEIILQLAASHHRICVVGDDAQSIYSFRGATIGNILGFQQTYPECKLFKLEQNYRSTQNIVNAANSLIKKNQEQIAKTVFSEKPVGEKITVLSAFNDHEEGYNVASQIKQMQMRHNYVHKDFAILYRTNAQSRIFEESLRKLNIPYRVYGGLSFYQRKEIKDVIAYMRLIANPQDELALKRIINYPTRGIGDTTVNKITAAANAQNITPWEVLSDPARYEVDINQGTTKKLADFKALIEGFRKDNETMDAYELSTEIIRNTGLIADLNADKTPEGLSKVQNMNELSNSLYSFVSQRMEAGNEAVKLQDFLAEISLLTDQDKDSEADMNRVIMTTVHSAKGLEFKNVFVVGMEENLFPSGRVNEHPQDLEEERRLFYVAVTRAEENLTLSYAKNRFLHGTPTGCRPSRFLQDIDPGYLQEPVTRKQLPVTSYQLPGSSYRRSFSSERPTDRHCVAGYDPQSHPQFHNNRAAFPNKGIAEQVRNDEKKLKRIPTASGSSHQSIGNLKVGAKIQHDRFGKGTIVELLNEADNAKAVVEFDDNGRKQLLLKFAKFEVID